ncbi:MAG: hypothetical protein CMO55_11205 [Verrucomicrobiales bacterium]|nr:hypothetical protein [Verrucomicrobiales bacterium]
MRLGFSLFPGQSPRKIDTTDMTSGSRMGFPVIPKGIGMELHPLITFPFQTKKWPPEVYLGWSSKW